MPEVDDWIHPLDAMAKREPIPRGAVRVIVLATGDSSRAQAVAQGLLSIVRQRGRTGSLIVVQPADGGWNRAIERGLDGSDEPIVVICTATTVPSGGHLDPLLKAIDARDHVVGKRPASQLGRVVRWLKTWPYRVLFAVPVADVFSPIQAHRRVALEAIPLQSVSQFVQVETLAKATFFVHTIEEVEIPDLPSEPVGPTGHDLRLVFTHPVLKREPLTPPGPGPEPALATESASADLSPAEVAESQVESDDRPGAQDR
jgi:hypothetical protein